MTTTATTSTDTNIINDNNVIISELRIPIVYEVKTNDNTDDIFMTMLYYELCHLFHSSPKRVVSKLDDVLSIQQGQQHPSFNQSSSSSSPAPLVVQSDIIRNMLLRSSQSYYEYYQEFCQMMNEQIQLHDQLSLQKKRILAYDRFLLSIIKISFLFLVVGPLVVNYHYPQRSTWYWTTLSILWEILCMSFYCILCLIFYLVLHEYISIKFIRPIIAQQNDILQYNVKNICDEMSRRSTASLSLLSATSTALTTQSSSIIPENIVVTFRLGLIPTRDALEGPSTIMDHMHIQCSTRTADTSAMQQQVVDVVVGPDAVVASTATASIIIRDDAADTNNLNDDDDRNSYRLLSDDGGMMKEKTQSFEVV